MLVSTSFESITNHSRWFGESCESTRRHLSVLVRQLYQKLALVCVFPVGIAHHEDRCEAMLLFALDGYISSAFYAKGIQLLPKRILLFGKTKRPTKTRWFLLNNTDRLLHRLEMIPHSAARISMCIKRHIRQSITAVLRQLHWLPVEWRINYKIVVLVFRALRGLAPAYVSTLITPYEPRRALRSAGSAL